MTQENILTLQQRLHGLAAFLPQFEQPDFCFGHWEESEENEPGVLTMPYFSFSAVAEEFIRAAYDLEWVRLDFDWPAWAQTPEAAQFRDDARAISNATPEQLSRLLTTVIRQDRFCDGELTEAFESGLLTALCRRAAQLESEMDRGKV